MYLFFPLTVYLRTIVSFFTSRNELVQHDWGSTAMEISREIRIIESQMKGFLLKVLEANWLKITSFVMFSTFNKSV